MRQQIQVRILDQAFMGSNLSFAVIASARGDFAATRATSFATMEVFTVS